MKSWITISLTQNKKTIIDLSDLDLVTQFKWCAHRQRHKWYAKRHSRKAPRHYQHPSLHRFLMGEPTGKQVDHINGNGLDNRKENLRLATNAENAKNRGKQSNNTTGYKGVFRNSKLPYMFEAKIGVNGRHIYLGLFDTPEKAYQAYKEAAIKYHGEFACV